jgi:hypothetical protein
MNTANFHTRHPYPKVIAGFLLAFTLFGCNDFLEKNPDNRVELNTVEKAAQLLTNAYPVGAYTFTEWMSDNVTFTTGTTILPEHTQSYLWEEVISDNQDTPSYYWSSAYEAIAHANEVLHVVDQLEGDFAKKNALKGEAYLARAYAHFMLANLFCKPYNPATAATDMGLPYVTEPEKTFIKTYERGNLKAFYEKIEDDILDGLSYVDDSYYSNSGKYHFNTNAALALASRFYLFKGDFTKCIRYSSDMLRTTPGTFVSDIALLLEQAPNANAFTQSLTSPSLASNLLLVRNITNAHVNVGYWPSPSIFNGLFNDNPWNDDDVRVSLKYPIYIRGSGYGQGKYEMLFERSSLTSNVGLYYTISPVLRGEEVLLNRAEAYLYNDQLELAIADMQTFVNNRYATKPSVTINRLRSYYGVGNGVSGSLILLNYILEERRKEFLHEGLRWFDIRRYGMPVVHVYDNDIKFLEEDDDRKVILLPQSAIDVSKLEQNPRSN